MDDLKKWDAIAGCLRDELEEYGALLQCMADQQADILRRDASATLEAQKGIEGQTDRCQRARERREKQTDALRLAEGLEAGGALREMATLAPLVFENTIQPLIDEINACVERVKRKAAQNHLLLGRACQFTEELIRMVQPEKVTRTYDRKGGLSLKASASGTRMTQSV